MTQPGTVIAIAGRRIDAPGAEPRFPAANIPDVRARLRQRFASSNTAALVGSAACGADLIALELAGEAGVRRRVVLPFAVARFRATSVVDRGEEWGDVFDRVIRSLPAADLVVLDLESNEEAYTRTNVEILNQARELAGTDHAIEALIVWNGVPRGPDDITLQFAEAARARHIPVTEISTLAANSV